MKNRTIKVLDNGYVKLIEAYGTGLDGVGSDVIRQNNQAFNLDSDYEVGIIEAARQSTQGPFRGWNNWHCGVCHEDFFEKKEHFFQGEGVQETCPASAWSNDEKLLRFLENNKHTTPFEFAGMVIEVKAPILVFREWHRHRTQSYNEMSARYAPLPDENYMPTLERLFFTQNKNKQAQAVAGSQELLEEKAKDWLEDLSFAYGTAELIYQKRLAIGIPKEVARACLPVGRYSQMRATANLVNWLKFLLLRGTKYNPNAQYEIRMFADAVEELIADVFPRTHKLFSE